MRARCYDDRATTPIPAKPTMTNLDLLIIAPAAWTPEDNQQPDELITPYGAVVARLRPLGPLRAAWVGASAAPFAAIYAAKAAGAARVVELAPVAARNRLLEPGDLLLPSDLVDCTRLPRYTFFAGKGYGFLAQREPFCPHLRSALLATAAAGAPRAFARGVYLATGDLRTVEPEWDADVAGDGIVPTSFLARELELCYAALCVVAEPLTPTVEDTSASPSIELLEGLLADALGRLPAERVCACATAMQSYRERGDIGPDWRTWVATEA
jgi:5'-methylthioadenosine phosphorylase